MAGQITLGEIEKNLDFFAKIYDIVRIVDPVNKRVVGYRGGKIEDTEIFCYDFWHKGRVCDNCISIHAYYKNKSLIKLEQGSNSILMIAALPVETEEKPIVLELLKNAADGLMIRSEGHVAIHKFGDIVAEMNDLMVKDPLTGLYNRRFIEDRLPVDIIKASLNKWPVSIVFIDVDKLKEINDTHGHLAGDRVIIEVGATIQSGIRTDIDWAARYGGDEFILCLNNTAYEEAYTIAERIRGNIEKMRIPIENETIQVTASLGIHTVQETKLTPEEIIHHADLKMYEAKKGGRNCTAGKPIRSTEIV